ncbi:MAG: hypothetical protein ACK506_04965 [Pirellula sp.]|jgi:hypothetical protein
MKDRSHCVRWTVVRGTHYSIINFVVMNHYKSVQMALIRVIRGQLFPGFDIRYVPTTNDE